ncbi:14-3-3 protein beta/theta/zeta [Nematocida sp. AWRm77]|nr:14-3-3 protein beta/theta/zeta [Nematocida sp. AWRm77]
MSYKESIRKAKLNEKAERFEKMAAHIKDAVKKGFEEGIMLNMEERNLLSIAYKNLVGTRRSSWRIISKALEGETGKEDASSEVESDIREILNEIIEELNEICNDLLSLLDAYLITDSGTKEYREKESDFYVFFLKMKGDYLRYKAEVATESEVNEIAGAAKDAYDKAMEIACAHLSNTHPTRLGLYLNYSVFYFEILKNKEKAVFMGKEAFDNAIADLDHLNENNYKDSTLIMQLLRDNLSLWTDNCFENNLG